MASAHWDTDSSKCFLKLCVEEIRKINKPIKSFKTEAWEKIRKRFHEVTGKDYTQKQFSNRLGVLKDDGSFINH